MKINIDYYTNYKDNNAIEKYNNFVKKYKSKINSLIKRALDLEKISVPICYIGIGVVTKEEIKNINNEFRKIDKATDVLSFPIFSRDELDKVKENSLQEEMSIGDIVLCMDVIEEHSIEYGTGFDREMLYMIVHGVCHLLGYDHELSEEKVLMRQREEEILKGI